MTVLDKTQITSKSFQVALTVQWSKHLKDCILLVANALMTPESDREAVAVSFFVLGVAKKAACQESHWLLRQDGKSISSSFSSPLDCYCISVCLFCALPSLNGQFVRGGSDTRGTAGKDPGVITSVFLGWINPWSEPSWNTRLTFMIILDAALHGSLPRDIFRWQVVAHAGRHGR